MMKVTAAHEGTRKLLLMLPLNTQNRTVESMEREGGGSSDTGGHSALRHRWNIASLAAVTLAVAATLALAAFM